MQVLEPVMMKFPWGTELTAELPIKLRDYREFNRSAPSPPRERRRGKVGQWKGHEVLEVAVLIV